MTATTDLNGFEAKAAHYAQTARKLQHAIDAVAIIHVPIPAVDYGVIPRGNQVQVCTGCGQDNGNWQYWPCPTIRAIREHVGDLSDCS